MGRRREQPRGGAAKTKPGAVVAVARLAERAVGHSGDGGRGREPVIPELGYPPEAYISFAVHAAANRFDLADERFGFSGDFVACFGDARR